jgi:hypothetical protein
MVVCGKNQPKAWPQMSQTGIERIDCSKLYYSSSNHRDTT